MTSSEGKSPADLACTEVSMLLATATVARTCFAAQEKFVASVDGCVPPSEDRYDRFIENFTRGLHTKVASELATPMWAWGTLPTEATYMKILLKGISQMQAGWLSVVLHHMNSVRLHLAQRVGTPLGHEEFVAYLLLVDDACLVAEMRHAITVLIEALT